MNTDAAEGSVRRDVCIEEQVCLALPKPFKGSLVASASRERDIQLLLLLTCIVDFNLIIPSFRLLGDASACNQRSRSTTCSEAIYPSMNFEQDPNIRFSRSRRSAECLDRT